MQAVLHLNRYSSKLMWGRGINSVTLILSRIVSKFNIKNEISLQLPKVPLLSERQASTPRLNSCLT